MPSMDVGGEDGPSNTATPHDDREDSGIDCDSFYPGSMHVINKGSLPIRFLVDDECIPIKIPKIAGNNMFYKNLHEKALEIIWPTIRTRWNAQNDKLKDDLMNHMVSLLGETFNKKCVTAVVGLNLKYVRADYKDNQQINHKYEHFPMVPKKEWKTLIEDAKEKTLRKQGKTKPIGSRRYGTYHIF